MEKLLIVGAAVTALSITPAHAGSGWGGVGAGIAAGIIAGAIASQASPRVVYVYPRVRYVRPRVRYVRPRVHRPQPYAQVRSRPVKYGIKEGK